MIGKQYIMLFLLIFSFFYLAMGFTACSGVASAAGVEGEDGIDGVDGTDGADGLAGTSIYLEDDNGTRYYSGASIYLGKTTSGTGFGSTISENFRIKNDSGLPLLLTGSGNYIQFDSYELLMFNNDNPDIDWFYESESSYPYFTLNESGLNSDPINPDDSSQDFTLTINAIDTGDNKFHFRRKYLIPLSMDGDPFNLSVEVTGFISTYNGTNAGYSW